jgi:hypothetical protein
MTVKALIVPSLLLLAGLVLLAIAMLAPPARKRTAVPASERVRGLERAASQGGVRALRRALRDPDPQVAAVAAILLRDARS